MEHIDELIAEIKANEAEIARLQERIEAAKAELEDARLNAFREAEVPSRDHTEQVWSDWTWFEPTDEYGCDRY